MKIMSHSYDGGRGDTKEHGKLTDWAVIENG